MPWYSRNDGWFLNDDLGGFFFLLFILRVYNLRRLVVWVGRGGGKGAVSWPVGNITVVSMVFISAKGIVSQLKGIDLLAIEPRS